jgi:predicted ribosome quality control (RQC) complex YloA/Tae2 family protein
MSLNWQEINLILDELKLENSRIQNIIQPDFRQLVLELYTQTGTVEHILFSLQDGMIRFHSTQFPPKKQKEIQRFAQLLISRIKGGIIRAVEHINNDRIICLSISANEQEYYLFFRLWGGRANILLTDENYIIQDALFRRPASNEITAKHFIITAPKSEPDAQAFTVRNYPQDTSFNQFIDTEYRNQSQNELLEKLQKSALQKLQQKAASLRKQLFGLEKIVNSDEKISDYRLFGNILLSNLETLQPGAQKACLQDFEGRPIEIQLDAARSIAENANQYFEKAKKAQIKAKRNQDLYFEVSKQLTETEKQIQGIYQDPKVLLHEKKTKGADKKKNTFSKAPGIQFISGDCALIVGKTARENDTLLRRYVKGNDWWLHVRDYSGAYVFIRPAKGKSVPLETLLDAGNLAVWYSKARSGGKAEVHYTRVKYLKRVKGGKTGLVIPTQDKNISIQIEQKRIDRLNSTRPFLPES